jgi:hypothetical protein
MSRLLIILPAAALVWFLLLRDDSVELGPGVRAPEAPLQSRLEALESFERDGYRITPLAEFRIRAKVLGRETYSSDREADLSPLDLALGWGRMSDEAVLTHIDISQSGRWYRWRTEQFPIPRREIETHSANMHLIAADDLVEDVLDDIVRGQVIELDGFLVRADADDGWRWISSLTREDTGARACELVYVKRARIVF